MISRISTTLSILFATSSLFAQSAPLPWQIEGETLESLKLRIDLSSANAKTPEATLRSLWAAQRGLESPAVTARLEAAVRRAREAVIVKHLTPEAYRALGGGREPKPAPAAAGEAPGGLLEILEQSPAEGGRMRVRTREVNAAGEKVRIYVLKEAADGWRIEDRQTLCAFCEGSGKKRIGPRKGEPCVKCAGSGKLPDDPAEPFALQGKPGGRPDPGRASPRDALAAYVRGRETEIPQILARLYEILSGPLRAIADRFFDDALRGSVAAALASPRWEDPVPALAPDQIEGETAQAAFAYVRLDHGADAQASGGPKGDPSAPFGASRISYRRLTLAKQADGWRIAAIEDACPSCAGRGVCGVCAGSPGKVTVVDNGREKVQDCPACKGIPMCKFCQGKGLKAIRSLDEF